MINMTKAQGWTRGKVGYGKHTPRPTILGNDRNGAFNCVGHTRLTNILRHFRFPESLVQSIKCFNTDRTVALAVDGEQETAVPFLSGLPQGSPISPVLFVIYAAALSS